jgi:hypothetical protein
VIADVLHPCGAAAVLHASSLPSAGKIDIGVLAMGAAQHLVRDLKGDSPLLAGNLFFEFRLTVIAQPYVAVWGYPEFHDAFLPFAGFKYQSSSLLQNDEFG